MSTTPFRDALNAYTSVVEETNDPIAIKVHRSVMRNIVSADRLSGERVPDALIVRLIDATREKASAHDKSDTASERLVIDVGLKILEGYTPEKMCS